MQTFRKIIQNNENEGDPGSQKKNEEDARNVSQDLEELKNKEKFNNTLEGTNNRITGRETDKRK